MLNITHAIKLFFPLFLLIFLSCQKTEEVQPASGPDMTMSIGQEEVSIMMMISSDIIERGTEAGFYAYINGSENLVNCGRISLQKLNKLTARWENIPGATNEPVTDGYADFTIAKTKLSDNGTYRWLYKGGANCNFKNAKSGSLELVVVKKKDMPEEEIYY